MQEYTNAEIAGYLRNGFWEWWSGTPDLSFDSRSLTVNLGGISAEAQALARTALEHYASVTGLQFSETAGAADITFEEPTDSTAHTNFTGISRNSDGSHTIEGAVVEVGSGWLDTYGRSVGSYSYQTFVHEIGHALGLGHAGPYNGGAEYGEDNTYANDSWNASVMSYFSQIENRAVDASFAYVLTAQTADLIALQGMYGAGGGRAGTTTYGYNASPGVGVYDADRYSGNISYTIYDAGGMDTLDFSGSSTDDRIDLRAAGAGSTEVRASDIWGETGNVVIAPGVLIEHAVGGDGHNTIIGNRTSNQIDGRDGDDLIHGGSGNDRLAGGAGSDRLHGGLGKDTLVGGEGADVLGGGAGNDRVYGGADNDRTYAGGGHDRVYGGGGDDWTAGRGGDDLLTGYMGNDTLLGDGGDDTLSGGSGNDLVDGGTGADKLYGGSGDDRLWGRDGNDLLRGGSGADRLYGGAGSDRMEGQGGSDVLGAGAGNDRLYGGAGADRLYGGGGRDLLFGEGGGDQLYGGAGRDCFIFRDGEGSDTVTDFARGVDTLVLNDGLWSGSLTPEDVINRFATLADDDAVFDFGDGDSIALLGVGTLNLSDDISIV